MSPGPHSTLELERSYRRRARGAAEKESEPHAKGFLSSLHPHERGFAGSHFDRTNLDRVPCFSSATRCGSLLIRYGRIFWKAIGSIVKISSHPRHRNFDRSIQSFRSCGANFSMAYRSIVRGIFAAYS